MRWVCAFLVFALAFTTPTPNACGEVEVPPLSGPVVDRTGTLSPADTASLVALIGAIEREYGSQIAILVIPTTAPETIEQFGIRVAERWQIGRRGVDDGVIIIVATVDRAVRLEVGYGLEGVLPDAVAKRIIEETTLPRFRGGDVPGGLAAAVSAIAALIRGEGLPPPTPRSENTTADALFILLALGSLLSLLATPFLGRFGAATIGGIVSAVIGFIITAPVLALLAGIMVFMAGLSGRARHGGYTFGRGGTFSGSRGYSGGGGSFGGGGASGRW